MIDVDKLQSLSVEIHKNACNHGWHEEKHSPEHWLGLVMSEVSESVEADRCGRRAKIKMFERAASANFEEGIRQRVWKHWFETCIKDSVEDEMADVVIRLLDMAYELYGDDMRWKGYAAPRCQYDPEMSFVENAWAFVSERLSWGTSDITEAIKFMFAWADDIGIDLERHVELKMQYNAMRPYKHGGKMY